MMRVLLLITLVFLSNLAFSQVGTVTEAQVRSELEKRGISEEELIREMNARGIEIEDLENLSTSQMIELEKIIAEFEERNKVEKPEGDAVTDDGLKETFLETPSTKETEQVKEQIKEVIDDVAVDKDEIPNIYGHSFFKNRDLSVFETSTEIKAPNNYILGVGDKIVVSIFGLSREELQHEIDPDGYIEVNNRKIFLKGLTLATAKEKLFQDLSRFYRFTEGQFEVSLSYSRTINVNIQGEVVSPGGYTMSAINNAYNGLVAAGGPSEIGSLREILLIRKEGSIVNLDFYSYLKNPNLTTNASLEEGDVLVVPVARKIVTIAGGVKRPMRYEMKSTEKLSDLIDLAGGFGSKANKSLVQVRRFSPGGTRFLNVQENEFQSFSLEDGDVISISNVDYDVENFIEIKGAVVNAGIYERTENLTVAGALAIGAIQAGARRDLAFIRRTQDNGQIIYLPINIEEGSPDLQIQLEDRDQISLTSLSLVNENETFKVAGAVRKPGSFNFAFGQTISIKDAIELAGGLRRDAAGIGIIHTKDPLNPKVKIYSRVDLADAFEEEEFYVLTSLDSLEVFSSELFDEASEVSISGAVNSPGNYQYGVGMTIGDVLIMSGGFRIGAAANRVEVYRLVLEDNEPTKTVIANLQIDSDITEDSENMDFELKPYDEIVVRFVPEFEFQQIVNIVGEVQFPGQYSLLKDNETVRDLILRAGGVTSEAFPTGAKLVRSDENLGVVIIKLDDILRNSNSRFNFKLRDGDEVIIPKARDFVSIFGATNASKLYNEGNIGTDNKINVPFHQGKDAKFYIEQYAGGVAKGGSVNEIYVENANGEITRTKNYFIYKNYPEVEPGSKIVVGTKPEKTQEQKEREDVDWSRVLADSVGQAVSILSLILLIQRL